MYRVKAYLKFLWRSTNQHGVHSPFVYKLVTLCFYDGKKNSSYTRIKKFRDEILRNSSVIEIKDFGAGSSVFTGSSRKVSAIAKTAGIPLHRARLLNRMVRYLRINSALELGTSVGLGSVAMAAGNSVQVTTLEGCRETAKVAQEQFRNSNFTNIRSVVGEFSEILPTILSEKTFDLVYIDGNHKKEPTLQYFRTLLPYAHNDSVFIFDDIHWSPEMTEAWEEIKIHSSVKVSIDTFFWGIVFFRKEQEKEHFCIRT